MIATKSSVINRWASLRPYAFVISIIAILGQVHFPGISKLIIPSIAFLFLLSWQEIYKKICIQDKALLRLTQLYGIALALLLLYSVMIINNNITLALRFYFILLVIPLAFFMEGNRKFVEYFLLAVYLHALILIVYEIYLLFFIDAQQATYIRNHFILNGLGDVYTFTGWFYKIQILGNPLIPIGLYTSFVYIEKMWYKAVFAGTLFVAMVIAGNFAFLISSLLFFVTYYGVRYKRFLKIKSLKDGLMKTIAFLIFTTPLVLYSVRVIKMKMGGVSISLRIEQMQLLMNDLFQNPYNAMLGGGLGNIIDVVTRMRDYSNAIYYELQTLYIMNQTGVVFFLLFISLMILLTRTILVSIESRLIFLSYLAYAVTNPYIFDATNIIVIVILVSLENVIKKKKVKYGG